jgi:hypothetical protein
MDVGAEYRNDTGRDGDSRVKDIEVFTIHIEMTTLQVAQSNC